MTREERLKRLAAFLRDFNILLDEIPAHSREAVRERFCGAVGAYLQEMELDNDDGILRLERGMK